MTTSVTAAELRAQAARARLSGTMGELQDRLSPRSLAREATQGLADTADRAARAGVDTVRDNPGTAVGAVAVAVAFLARRQIARLLRKGRRNLTD